MLIQKRFGRKVPLPSIAKIKFDLLAMANADTLVDEFEKQGVTKEYFSNMISKSVGDKLLSPSRAQMLTSRHGRGKTGIATTK